MKILHFIPVYIPSWKYGGPILSVSRLCEGLVSIDIEVRVVTTNAGLMDSQAVQSHQPILVNGVPVYYYPVDSIHGPIYSKALVRDLDSHMSWADLVHVSSVWQPLGLTVQKKAHMSGTPLIQSTRGALSPYSWTRGYLKKLIYYHVFEKPLLQRAAAIHCTTQMEVQEVKKLRLDPPVKILPNPIDQTYLHYSPHLKDTWCKSHGLPANQPLLLVAGRLHHKKGLDLLPSILAELQEKPWHILFIGQDDDGTVRSLKTKMSNHHLSHRCHWMTAIPANELLYPYNSADWLLLPSRHENFGNVVIEALACGCGALVSTCVGVSTELSTCPGFFATSRNHYAFKSLLSSALETPRPGSLSSQWISEAFSISAIANKAVTMYSEVLSA